jgi:hypothetical protein
MLSSELAGVSAHSSSNVASDGKEPEAAPGMRLLGHIVDIAPSKRHQIAMREWGEGSRLLRAFRVESDTTIFTVVLIPDGKSRRTPGIRQLALTELKTGDLVLVRFEVQSGRAVTQVIEKLS